MERESFPGRDEESRSRVGTERESFPGRDGEIRSRVRMERERVVPG